MIEIVCDKCGAKEDLNEHITPAGFSLPYGWVTVLYGEIAARKLWAENYCPECAKKVEEGE